MIPSLCAAAAAFLLAMAAMPFAGKLAARWGMLDHPDQRLKRHERPVPYLGGLAVAVAFGAALAGVKFWMNGTIVGVVGVLAGSGLITLLGLVDDKHALKPETKFLGQVVAALILIACNMRLQFIHPPVLSALLTVIWVVGVTNAMNLIDIMDGLSAGVSAIAAAVFFLIAAHNGRTNDMFIVAALGGAVLGFLPFNFPGARIYLGDTGALLLGFVLSSVAVGESYSQVNSLAVLAPVLILGVPIFDTLFIMFIRHRRGVSMFRGSPDHVALRLVRAGLSRRQTVLVLWGGSAALGAAAYASIFLPQNWSLLLYLGAGLLALFAAERLSGIVMDRT